MNFHSSDLRKYFNENERLIDKWEHYFDIYERHFNRYRNTNIVVVEIGVYEGGSLQLWKRYFGDNAKIFGIDIDPACKGFEEDNIEILIGSQSDRDFLREIRNQIPKIDILIDDGGHTMKQQIVTFEELFDHVKDEGIYLCEDLHTSYWLKWGGGYKRRNTFIEYSKNFIDYLHAFHSGQKSLKVNSFTRTVDSIHFYDSIIVIEKRKRDAPKQARSKSATVKESINLTTTQKIRKTLTYIFLMRINKILRFFRLPGFIWR